MTTQEQCNQGSKWRLDWFSNWLGPKTWC